MAYLINGVVKGVADITSTNGDLNELPLNYQIGSSCTWTGLDDGKFHLAKLSSVDGTIENKVWKKIC